VSSRRGPLPEILIESHSDELTHQLGHTPADAELAGHLGISDSDLREAQLADLVFRPCSLDAPLGDRPDAAVLADVLGADDPGMEHALEHPPGLLSLVVANSPASLELWVSEANRLRALLPPEVQDALDRHEAAGTTDSPEYERAVMRFYERHLCRIPFPDALQRTFDQLAEDPTVYHTMNGPSEFHVIGSLRGWDITPRLGGIDVPVLVISGEHDEATPADAVEDLVTSEQYLSFGPDTLAEARNRGYRPYLLPDEGQGEVTPSS